MRIYKCIMMLVATLMTGMTMAQEGVVYSVQQQGDDGDVQTVDVLINGHEVRFALDTGCSDVPISQDMFNEIKKVKAIRNSDCTGELSEYNNADTRVSKGQFFIHKKLVIGEVELSNVRAHVTNTSDKNASMLLGHSVLRRFKRYMIKDKTLTFELKDKNVMDYQLAEEKAEFWYRKETDEKNENEKKIIELMEPFVQTDMITDQAKFMYANNLIQFLREEEAVPYLKELLEKNKRQPQCYTCFAGYTTMKRRYSRPMPSSS